MRIKITPARSKRTAQWREWYAWRPVYVEGAWVWLETIERRWIWSQDGYGPDFRLKEYRIPKDSP